MQEPDVDFPEDSIPRRVMGGLCLSSFFFFYLFFCLFFFFYGARVLRGGGGYGQLAEDLVDCWLITGCVGGAGVVAVPGPVWAWVVSYCGLGLGVAVGVWKILSFYGFLEALRVGRAYELWQ